MIDGSINNITNVVKKNSVYRFSFHEYRRHDRYEAVCYRSTFPWGYYQLKQECCYDWSDWATGSFPALITEFPYHGHVTNGVSFD